MTTALCISLLRCARGGVPSKFCDKNGEIGMRSWTFPQGRVHRETGVDDANERTENGRGGS